MEELSNTFNSKQAAKYVGVSEASLRLWRSEGVGPRFYRAGVRLVRYRKSDLDQWIERRLIEPTDSTATSK